MKILQLTNKPPWPPHDGGAIAMLNMTTGLSMTGNQVTVLAMNTRKHHVPPGDMPPDLRLIAEFNYVDVPASPSPVTAFFNLIFSDEPYTAVRFCSRHFREELTATLQGSVFDIIQLEGTYLCPYIPDIRRHSGAVIALRAHNIESEIWNRTASASKGFKKWYLSHLTRRICKFEQKWMNVYDVLIPITACDGDHFDAAGNLKPKMVIPGGIDFSSSPDQPTAEETLSLFHIGSLDWMPNQEGLLWFLDNCWDSIHRKYPALSFCIAGRNAPDWLISRLKRPGVLFYGEIENARDFIRQNGVMVVPLLSGSGMRIKIIEGMALGKAVVTTTIGAEGLEVTDCKNIMMADDPAEFIRKTEEVLSDPLLRKRLGENAFLFAREHYDHIVLARKLTDFYHQITMK